MTSANIISDRCEPQAVSVKPKGSPSGALRDSTLISVTCLIVFLLFRSNFYASVDGPLRCLQVFHENRIFFHGNNHLLYPFWIFLWARVAGLIGIHPDDAFQFIRLSQAMNAAAAAAAIGMLYFLMRIAASRRGALLGIFIFSLSTACLLHATNSAEVMPGFLFAMLALTLSVLGNTRDSFPALVLAGLALALALASYEAMGVAGVIVGFVCCFCPAPGSGRRPSPRATMLRLTAVSLGGLVGVATIYGLVYHTEGVTIRNMPSQFFAVGGNDGVYGGFRVSRFLNLPFGLVKNLDSGIPEDYAGVRSLLQTKLRTIWIAVASVNLALLTTIAVVAGQGLCRLISTSLGYKWLAFASLPCLALVFPLVYWDPLYDKLWLLPLATGAFLVALSLRPDATESRLRPTLARLVVFLALLQAAVNLPRLIHEHFTKTPHLDEARQVSALIRNGDWVVLDFDDISGLWLNAWGTANKHLMVPASTDLQTRQWLADAEKDSRTRGCRILFVGILDQDRKTWDAFLGSRVKIPYAVLDEYRSHAQVICDYSSPGHPFTVRAYNAR